jgi:hypothetical protein
VYVVGGDYDYAEFDPESVLTMPDQNSPRFRHRIFCLCFSRNIRQKPARIVPRLFAVRFQPSRQTV